MDESLDYRGRFDPGIFAFLAARAVDGVEAAGPDSYARALVLPGGHGWFTVDRTPDGGGRGGGRLRLRTGVQDDADLPELIRRVRHLFNLDADLAAIDAALGADALLAPGIAAAPGIRLPGCVDPGEILIRAMIGQQITVAAARNTLHKLAVLGTPSNLPHGGLVRMFPTAAQLAAGGRAILRGPARRIDSVIAVAGMLADGSLELSAADTVDSLAAKLLPVPGIGPWTVGYVAMRVLGSPDVFLPTDAAVRNGYAALSGDGVKPTPKELAAASAAWAPWRSYATLHLWRAAAGN
ncbi:DNA-3-methyladenine glycosylase family protein [Arthrobacter sp. 35W]|uniref:DNA-3-methyladenine glycosylase family protein n=1 Tax=Arthrobacter sp. 35W TaxID=1132441 RepID=UPI0004058AAB|nr:AlkA N-terminal domain-containing protein [Arthrobacter sp. 35W]